MTVLLDLPAVEASPSPAREGRVADATSRSAFRRGVVLGALGLAAAWPLGLVYLGWPLLGLVAAVVCATRRYSTFPRVLAGWFALMVLVTLSLAQVETTGRLLAFGYRFAQFAAATVICLLVYGARRRISHHLVFGVMAGCYLVVVASGLLGLVAPTMRVPSLALQLMPALPPEARFVVDGATMRPAQVVNLLGTSEPRPKGVFAYTNDWAAVYALLTVVLYAYLQQARRLGVLWLAVAAAGVYPLIESLSRGAWGALLAGLAAVTLARTVRQGARGLAPALVVVAVGCTIALQGPVLATIQDRLNTPHSDEGRTGRVEEALQRVADQRPLMGFGTPLPRASVSGPSLGTHGQLWLHAFCQGFPGAIAFLLWLLALARFAVRAGPTGEALLGALTVLAVQAYVYEWAALQLNVLLALVAVTAAAGHHRTGTPGRPSTSHPQEGRT